MFIYALLFMQYMALFTITKKEDKAAMPQLPPGLGDMAGINSGMSGFSPTSPPKLTSVGGSPQGQQGMFSGKKEAPADPRIAEAQTDVNNQNSRLRTLEERYSLLRRKTQVTEQNMLGHYKKATTDIKTALSRIQEIKNEVREIKEKIELIEKEIEQCAKKNELQLIHKYVNYWNPAEFVTKEEAKRIIEEKLRDMK